MDNSPTCTYDFRYYTTYKKQRLMGISITQGNETYIYMNGELIHKTRNDNSQSGVTFDVMAYRKSDSLLSIY